MDCDKSMHDRKSTPYAYDVRQKVVSRLLCERNVN